MASTKRKEPVHRLLYLCSTFTPDSAWSDFLKDCSYGKFPRGVRFEDNSLKCTRKKQTFTVPIPTDPEKAVQIIIQVFRDRLNIKTNREVKSAAIRFDRQRAENQIVTWKDASTAAAKNALLSNFVERFSIHYGLSTDETRQMNLLLSLALLNKTINSKNIVLVDGRISQIVGLQFNPSTRKVSLAGPPPKYEVELKPVPIDFRPVRQINHEKVFIAVLNYHVNKTLVT